MHKLGSDVHHAREMVLDDVLRGRIDLLILMAIDFLQGTPFGDQQRRAMEKNAIHVEAECFSLMGTIEQLPFNNRSCVSNDFCHCLKLLAIMIRSVAKGDPMDASRKKSMLEIVQTITEMLDEEDQIDDSFLENCLSIILLRLISVI